MFWLGFGAGFLACLLLIVALFFGFHALRGLLHASGY